MMSVSSLWLLFYSRCDALFVFGSQRSQEADNGHVGYKQRSYKSIKRKIKKDKDKNRTAPKRQKCSESMNNPTNSELSKYGRVVYRLGV